MPLKICQSCGAKVIADARAPDPFYCRKCAPKANVIVAAVPAQLPIEEEPPMLAPMPILQPPPEEPKITTLKITCPYCTAIFASRKLEVTAKGRCPICKQEVFLFPDGSVKKPEDMLPKPPPPPPPPAPIVVAEPPPQEQPSVLPIETPVADEPKGEEDIPELKPQEEGSTSSTVEEKPAEEKPPEPASEDGDSDKTEKKEEGRTGTAKKILDRKTSRFGRKETKSITDRVAKPTSRDTGRISVVGKRSKSVAMVFMIPFIIGIVAQVAKSASVADELFMNVGKKASDGLYSFNKNIAGAIEDARARQRKPPKLKTTRPAPDTSNGAPTNGGNGLTPDNGNVPTLPPPPPELSKEEQLKSLDYTLCGRHGKIFRKERDIRSLSVGADENRKKELEFVKAELTAMKEEQERDKTEYLKLSGTPWIPPR